MAYKISEKVSNVGKIDWELRKFHGEELSTHFGSSYNAYLIKDEKNVLIDTVFSPFDKEFIQNLSKEIDITKIDYIVINHGEPDHSGALPALMEIIPDTPIYCTASGAKSLRGYYHKDWNFKVVKTGDKLELGENTLTFIETSMLHWPDSMACWLDKEKILFSMDIFGQHFASEFMFDTNIENDKLIYEAMKYYANIVQPFSAKVTKKLQEIEQMNLDISLICPSHGVTWKENPHRIVELYSKWAEQYSENQVTVVYETMYNSTRRMAVKIAEGIRSVAPDTTIKIYNCSRTDKSDLLTEVFRSKAVVVGSPSVNNGILTHTAALLEDMKNLSFSGKTAASFCSYGWSPAAIKIINQKLQDAGFALHGDGLKAQWNPSDTDLQQCFDFGKEFAEKL